MANNTKPTGAGTAKAASSGTSDAASGSGSTPPKPAAKPAAKKPTAPTSYYCPGCGATSSDAGECVGGEFGHPAIELVDAAELAGDPANLTPAPNSE